MQETLDINNPMLIRQIEAEILEALLSGAHCMKELNKKLSGNYSSIHSVLGRMVMYDIVIRGGKGLYMPNITSYKVANDTEVLRSRRSKKSPKTFQSISFLSDPDLQIEILDYIKMHLIANIHRNVIWKSLKKQGFGMTKFELNRLIYQNKLDKRRIREEETMLC